MARAQYEPRLGDTVEDAQRQAIGRIMGFVGPYVQVRPIDGGREWDALRDSLQPVPLTALLSAGVAAANARSRSESSIVNQPIPVPFGLTRMRPFPDAAVLVPATVVLDLTTQTGRWLGPDGLDIPALDRHKRSETSKETKTRTSLDGTPDEGMDQQGDSD
ncbi:putative ATP-grasp-modified RiPP [Streptomyces sp. NPDC087844]|uniref:putative ATP-grasp-modified RiPP n=1 Tax=Streptomyces sp. NPDC087844 TaxID=3365805 RepID=UPI0037F73F1B